MDAYGSYASTPVHAGSRADSWNSSYSHYGDQRADEPARSAYQRPLDESLRVLRLRTSAPSWEPPAVVDPPQRTSGRKHFHAFEPPRDAAGMLSGTALHGRPRAQRNHVTPLPPPAPRAVSPRPGLRPAAHVFGGRVVRGETADEAAAAAGLAHWRTGGRREMRRHVTPATPQRPATANPLDMIAHQPATASPERAQRGRGAPAPDMLLAHGGGAPRLHQVWPPGRPSVSWADASAPRLHLARGVPGAGADSVAALMTHGVRSDRLPRPSMRAFVTHSRGTEYQRNRARINATSVDLTAPPLYDVRPGTAPPGASRPPWL